MLAFWPGLLSPDSVYQLQQIASGAINDWHPAFHTLTLWLITRIWFAPAPVVIVQITILSALIGWGLSLIQTLGTPAWLTWCVDFFFAISPGISSMLLTIWKDIAYSLALLALTLLILKIVNSRGKWLKKSSSWIIFGIVTALVALYRHNGAFVAFGTLTLHPVVLSQTMETDPSSNSPGWSVVARRSRSAVPGDRSNTSEEAQGRNLGLEGWAYSLIHYHSLSGSSLLPEEQDILSKIVDERSLATYSDDLEQHAIQITLRNPLVTFDYLLGQSTFIFQVIQPPHSRKEYVGLAVYDNPFGLKLNSKIPSIQTIYTKFSLWSEKPTWDWFFWRNAFWMYLFVFSSVIACIRQHSWYHFLLVFPVLLNALPFSAFSGGQLARYILPSLLISPLFSGYLLMIPKSQDYLNRIE